jgi:hypothetical protein
MRKMPSNRKERTQYSVLPSGDNQMNDPQTKQELITKLRHVQERLTADVQAMSAAQFSTGTPEAWSAADYLKHLILSVKPAAKGLRLPAERLKSMFGQVERPAYSYSQVVALYQKRLDEGIRAEDYDKVVPVSYRFPEGMTDEQQHLIEAWNESNTKFIEALEQWTDEELDSLQLPHPAVGLLSLREMGFFTLHHNALHWQDIQHAGARAER